MAASGLDYYIGSTNVRAIQRDILQKPYTGTTSGFQPHAPILFEWDEVPGVPLTVAINPVSGSPLGDVRKTGGVTDGHVVMDMITSKGTKVSLRVLWPGCQPAEIYIGVTKTVQGTTQKIDKAKLASNVAKGMQKFYETYRRAHDWQQASDSGLTPDKIPFYTLVLMRLDHVSLGSYQPVLTTRSLEFAG